MSTQPVSSTSQRDILPVSSASQQEILLDYLFNALSELVSSNIFSIGSDVTYLTPFLTIDKYPFYDTNSNVCRTAKLTLEILKEQYILSIFNTADHMTADHMKHPSLNQKHLLPPPQQIAASYLLGVASYLLGENPSFPNPILSEQSSVLRDNSIYKEAVFVIPNNQETEKFVDLISGLNQPYQTAYVIPYSIVRGSIRFSPGSPEIDFTDTIPPPPPTILPCMVT